MFHSVELSKAAPNENPSPTPVRRDAASGMIPLAACLCSGPRTCPASVALHRWIIVYRARPCPSPPFISNNTFRCPRLLSARMMSPFLLLPTPERGVGGAPGGAHLVSSFALARRESRVSETRHIPLRPGRRPSALHRGDFRPPGRRVISGCANRIGVATCPGTGRKAWPGPGPPVPRFAPQRRDATPRSALQDRLRKTPLMSEDANLSSMGAICSQ